MDHLASQILGIINGHPELSALIIGLTAFGESFVFLSLLFPGTAVLIAAGALVSEGVLNPAPVVIAGFMGAVLGDAASFWLGQRFGDLLPKLWPFRGHPKRLERGIDFFKRFGGTSVFIGRFFGPLRAVVPTAAGMMHMPMWHFYAANIVSAAIWAPALVFSGDLLTRVLAQEGFDTKVFFVVLMVAAIAAVIYVVRRQLLAR
jgi:membrane protein DedA with SNARE-associated domain